MAVPSLFPLKIEIVGIGAEPSALVQCIDRLHLIRCEREIKHFRILTDPVIVHRFRDHDDPMLYVPPEHDLRGSLLMLLRELGEKRKIEIPFHKRAPRLDDDIVQHAKIP